MFSVGLTGGIASGKTTISNLFVELGVLVIDTDVISRNLLAPGELAYRQVCAHFGKQILLDNGEIDRATLRNIIFSNPQQKSWLETMLHPLIFQRSHDAIVENSRASYVLVVVPLLFETNFQSLVDRILVVDCPADQQIQRLMKRDDIDDKLANSMLAQQLSNAERLTRAHDIIDNREDDADLVTQVAALHQFYTEHAESR
jgi:dephospho-CoA kinase